jgi:hypothetical protein
MSWIEFSGITTKNLFWIFIHKICGLHLRPAVHSTARVSISTIDLPADPKVSLFCAEIVGRQNITVWNKDKIEEIERRT